MTPIDVLIATKQRLVAKGWTPHIGRCLYMTMESVVPDEIWYGTAPQRVALDAIRAVTGEYSIADWNDKQASIESVLAAIDAAIGRCVRCYLTRATEP